MTERSTDPSTMVASLGELEPFDEATLTIDDGTTVTGRVNPIDYTPDERLRLEVRLRLGEDRYELRSAYTGGQWSTPVVRRCGPEDDDWTAIGSLVAVETTPRRALEGVLDRSAADDR